MNSFPVILAVAGATIPAGCTSYDVRPAKEDALFTHDMRIDLGLTVMPRWNDQAAGTGSALRVARKTCGTRSNVTAEELKLTRGLAFANTRTFTFACPNSVKEEQ